jgi:hypothetical protein
MFKVGNRIVGKAALPNFFQQIVGKHGVVESVNSDDPIGPYFVRFDDPELGTGSFLESDLELEREINSTR